MRLLLSLLLCAPLILASEHDSSQDQTQDENVKWKPERDEEVARGNTQFALKVYNEVSSDGSRSLQENIFFSPLSISTAFAMLAQGAKSATHQQIIEALCLNGTQNDREINEAFQYLLRELNAHRSSLQVSIGNALFVDQNLKMLTGFRKAMERYYRAGIKKTNFAQIQEAERQINDYVRKETGGKIQKLVEDLGRDAVMVLVNYILFKGEWQDTFNQELTRDDQFSMNSVAKIQVPMMHRVGLYKTYRDDELNCEVIQLPYKEKAYMVVAVPKDGEIIKVERSLSEETLKRWIHSPRTSLVDLSLPKFSFSAKLDLKTYLSRMGMVDVFGGSANLSKISGNHNLLVSKALHEAVLNVNEYGTEASGATATDVNVKQAVTPFRVDRPFLLFIYSKETKSILFMGRVINPTHQAVSATIRRTPGSLTMRWSLHVLLLVTLCLGNPATKGGGNNPRKEQHDHHGERNESSTVTDPVPLNHTQPPAQLSVHDVTEMNTNFGFNLYRKMADKHDNNIFLSPFSVSFSLGSLMLGTQGLTQDQILDGLNLQKFKNHEQPLLLPSLFRKNKLKITENEAFILDAGSFAFIHETFPVREEFYNLTHEYFSMEFQYIDFHNKEAKNIVNDYVNKKTRGKISQLYDSIDPLAKLVLLDYILFKGKWQYPFNPNLTENQKFYIDKYNSVTAPMMYKMDKVHWMVDKSLSCTVLKIPYKGGAHMLVVIPEKDGDLVTIEDNLSKELLDIWQGQMKYRKTEIFFPKFKLDQKYQLKTSLEEMGIQEIFTGKANLTRLTEERNLRLSEVTQRAVIEVDERGTEASAVTGAEIIPYMLTPIIRVDRPFLFMIFEEACNSLLFIGRVVDPTKF
ncbi:protein Z-dependent protease inhibitor [Spea bombifrons]|uniref:protein Z-dependent protease inhibitor n=1 Tax=Spea bombifrons TaxID=233779 RepID=UPI00234A1BFE|nr:protein Z-dependent protease inhibitor [Spea bombifrons]